MRTLKDQHEELPFTILGNVLETTASVTYGAHNMEKEEKASKVGDREND